MQPGPLRRVTADLYAISFACGPTPQSQEWASCIDCGGRLDLIQPDQEMPERLLGTCGKCGRWYVASFRPTWATVWLVCLPNPGDLLS